MRRIVAWVLGWRVVWLQDFDGETVQRLARETPYGLKAYRASRLAKIGPVLLLPDGSVRGVSYVSSWLPDA